MKIGIAGVGAVVAMTLGLFPSGFATAQAQPPEQFTVSREDEQSFRIAYPDSPTVQVTFLTSKSFRVRVLAGDEAVATLPDYMRVRSDASYLPVDVEVDAREEEVIFKTTNLIILYTTDEDTVSLSVRTPDKVLIGNWDIDAGDRTAELALRTNERIFGFGDKRAAIDQRGNRVEMLNRDAFASETNASYKSIPFYMSSAGYGLFFHNFHPSMFDVGASSRDALRLTATGGEMDFYFFAGDLQDVLSQYTELTGRPAMLPRWAFGYHQGKASYHGREAAGVAEEMRRRKLPVDVIYYDDWESEAVSKEFIESLWQRHRVRLTFGFGMPMFGSYGSNDDSAFVRDLGSRGMLMVDQRRRPVVRSDEHVDTDGQESRVAYLDYFSGAAVEYVFASKWEQALRDGALLGMVDFGEMDRLQGADQKFWPSLNMSVAETRNLFGLAYALSIVEGTMLRTGGRSTGMVRPGFAGTQRLGWSTTGDSLPTYRNFHAHMRGMLNLTLSGFSNVGQDIGGWDSKGPDVLYARWFAAGTFYPFMWSHGQGDHEPYSHGATVERAAREFLNLRYRLVPYLYSLHEAAHRTGVPMLRSFALQEPAVPNAHRIDDAYFLGDNLLVAPLLNDKGDRKVYLPRGIWYDFFAETPPVQGGREIERTSVPLDRIPAYVRAGAVIPLGPAMQHTAEKPVDPLSVYVYSFARQDLGREARVNEFALYEDDGESTAYQQGEFQNTILRFEQTQDAVRFEITPRSGDGDYRTDSPRNYQLHFHGLRDAPSGVLVNGQEIPQASPESFGSGPSWSRDHATGAIRVAVPSASQQAFVVELAVEGDHG